MFASEVVEMVLLSCIGFSDGSCNEVNEVTCLDIQDLSPPVFIPQPDSEKRVGNAQRYHLFSVDDQLVGVFSI